MAQDASDRSIGDLPDGVSEWVTSLAEDEGVSEEEILGRLLSAGGSDGAAVPESFAADIDELQSSVADLETQVTELDSELDTKIDDVRERVIQVKRATDEKADGSHDHADLEVRLDNLDDDLDHLAIEMDELEDDIESSWEDVEDDLQSLRDDLDDRATDLAEKVEILAITLIDLRDRVQSLLAASERQRHIDDLQAEANRHGVRAAACGNCSERVELGLLTAARCPHCNEAFEELSPKDGFFGSNVLETGQPPALEGEVGMDDDDLEGIVEE